MEPGLDAARPVARLGIEGIICLLGATLRLVRLPWQKRVARGHRAKTPSVRLVTGHPLTQFLEKLNPREPNQVVNRGLPVCFERGESLR